ncbi:HNH endonuclease [Streptomyces anulatus]|uniref:HNH endonuclease n=1 Tax=Streptomyces anulatus TaxID=1892 RepID=UPI002ED00C66|nr:HNH endonuclease [Streptomyces anulatus]
MAVSKRLRYEILRRDNHACRYCGATAPDVPLRVDHVAPVALGGSDTPDNLVTSCEPCNSGKSSATVDAAVVAGVSDDAIRWAEAMKKAAAELSEQNQPKLDYRNAFESEWNGWTYPSAGKQLNHELPADWKTSLDRFRQAGLPVEVWPDIVERAMVNKTVKADNLFRYCCGIAWRMVDELHEAARRHLKVKSAKAQVLSHLDQVIVDAWASNWLADHEEAVTGNARANFTESLVEFRGNGDWVSSDRLLAAALAGGCERSATIQDAMAALIKEERSEVVIDWIDAWTELTGEPPDNFLCHVVQGQVDELADSDLTLSRTRRAAILAGYHRSSELHHGLRESQVRATGVTKRRQTAIDIWCRSFWASAGRWPTDQERASLIGHLDRIVSDADFHFPDVYAAATAAGAYQDPDLSTCLERHGSVFEVAARPLAPTA